MKPMIKQPWRKSSATEPGPLPGKGASTSNVILAVARTGSRLGERINPKWAWHYRTLIALRKRLLRERDDLLKAASEPLESFSMDMADAATDQFDHDLVLSRLSSEQDALYEVDAAIKRILDGSYGMCEQTGQPIPQARLRAIPWTRSSGRVESWGRLARLAVSQARSSACDWPFAQSGEWSNDAVGDHAHELQKLIKAGAPVDGFGIGLRLDTSADAPYLDCAYKIQQCAGRPRRKTFRRQGHLAGKKAGLSCLRR